MWVTKKLLILLTGLLAACVSNVPQSSSRQASTAQLSKPCESPDAKIEVRFIAADSLNESWDFKVLPQYDDPSQVWAWICASFALELAATRGTASALLGPEQYQRLVSALEEAVFFELPANADGPVTIDSPTYVIEARDGGNKHRVKWTESSLDPRQKERFLRVWETFFQFVPLQPAGPKR